MVYDLIVKIISNVICVYCPVVCHIIATNVQVFMKKGEFGKRLPVTGAGFCSKVELLPTAS